MLLTLEMDAASEFGEDLSRAFRQLICQIILSLHEYNRLLGNRVFPSSAEHHFLASLHILNCDSLGIHNSCTE